MSVSDVLGKIKNVATSDTSKQVGSSVLSSLNKGSGALGGAALGGMSMGYNFMSGVAQGGGAMAVGVAASALRSDAIKYIFLGLLTIGVHVADYMYFGFSYNILRVFMYGLFAIIFAAGLSQGDERARTQTIKAILGTILFFIVFTNLVTAYLPRYSGNTGMFEFFAGLVMILIAIQRPGIFVKGPLVPYVHTCFVLCAAFTPYLTNGITDQFLSNYATFAFVYKAFLSPLMWPWFLWVLILFVDVKPFLLKFLMLVTLLLFLSPLWMSVYQNQIANASISPDQYSAFFAYWQKAKQNTALVGEQTALYYNATKTYVTCSYYGFTSDVGSATGGTGTGSGVPAYCKTATGTTSDVADSFDASVESGSVSSAGITMDPIVNAQQKVYATQDATFLTILKAQSFNTRVAVNVSCFAKLSASDSSAVNGIIPETSFVFTQATNKDIVCRIPSVTLAAGRSYTLDVGADFNYVASAYLRRYFTKQGLLSQFASKSNTAENGFFAFYQLSDTNPKSIATRGPVLLGLDVANPVIELADETTGASTSFTLRLILKNVVSWKGKMLSADGIMISLPKGFDIKHGLPMVKPKNADTVTWSDLACTVSGFIGNFQQVNADQCAAMNSDPSVPFKNLNCESYNNYILVPTPASARTAVKVDDGQERNQQIYLTCEIMASSPAQILNGAPYAIKSLRASTAYTYSIHQTKSFTVEKALPGENKVYADQMLASRSFCGTANAYTLDPVLEKVFVGETVNPVNILRTQYDSMITTVGTTVNGATADNGPAQPVADGGLITGGTTGVNCMDRSIAQAIMLEDWNQLAGNAMVTGSSYGYLRANKAMLAALNVTAVNLSDSSSVDTFLRSNYLLTSMQYIDKLIADCGNDPAGKSSVLTCAVGKYECGAAYHVGDTSGYCAQTKVPEVVTLATQISQILMGTTPANSASGTTTGPTGATS